MAINDVGASAGKNSTKLGARAGETSELKALRRAMSDKHKPLSQPKFAELLGVGRDIVCAVEIGIKRLTPNIARRIRSCTGCMIFSPDEEIRGPGWENLPLVDFVGRSYAPESYQEWCHWKASLNADGTTYRGNFLGEAICILSECLRHACGNAPMELRNNRLINFWNQISDVMMDFLAELGVRTEVEQELVRRFGEKRAENLFVFLRCLLAIGLPLDGEFCIIHREGIQARPDVQSVIRGMCTFQKWRWAEWKSGQAGRDNTASAADLENVTQVLYEEYERGNLSMATLEKLLAIEGFKTRYRQKLQNSEKIQADSRESRPKTDQFSTASSEAKGDNCPESGT
jgi:transcriptional regulator with XRE-family HTH domain